MGHTKIASAYSRSHWTATPREHPIAVPRVVALGILGVLLLLGERVFEVSNSSSLGAIVWSRTAFIGGVALIATALIEFAQSFSCNEQLTSNPVCPDQHWAPDAIWVPVGLVPLLTGCSFLSYLARDCSTIRFRDLDFVGAHLVFRHLGDPAAPIHLLFGAIGLVALGLTTILRFCHRRKTCAAAGCHSTSWWSIKALLLLWVFAAGPILYVLYQGGNKLYR